MARLISHENGGMWMENCCQCKVPFAMDDATYKTMSRQASKGTFHCPHGHQQCYREGESDLDIMRRERDRALQRVAERDDDLKLQSDMLAHAKRSAIAYKGKVTRLKNRAAVGLCPCCNRSFSDLARHMAGQHPEYVMDDHSLEAAE